MKKITVLGAGMVGSAIAKDLSTAFDVTSVDISDKNLQSIVASHPSVKTKKADLQRYDEYPALLAGADWVITAVPGFMGYKTLEAVIRAGKSGVDISFFPEDALQLDALAKTQGVTIITDCGVAPGMSNLILGRYHSIMKLDRFLCYVGGLPKHPQPPFKYKAPFSPIDVIEEYTRPARLKIAGELVTKPALSDREMLNFGKVGELEAFNTDGLRSILETITDVPTMLEKTLRYPGHIDLIIALQQAGFFGTEEIDTRNGKLKPMDLTTRLLLDQWKLEPGEAEFTIMRVQLEGEGKQIVYDLYDEYDVASGISSMARTTGYTCTAAMHVLGKGLFKDKGIFPPELIGKDETIFHFMLDYLRQRNVIWKKEERALAG